jgi:hypothetical protein
VSSGNQGSLKSARAGRASRAGARAGRIVRLVRMVKLYKYFKKTEEKEGSQHASHSNISGSDIISKPIENGEEDEKDDSALQTSEVQMEPESRVGAAISDLTTRRFIITHKSTLYVK